MRAITWNHLKLLSTVYKRDFSKALIKKDEKVDKHLYGALKKVRDGQDEIAYELWDIENAKDEVKGAFEGVDKAAKKKAQEVDMQNARKMGKGYKFNLHNIKDMEKLYGDSFCWACKKGYECKKHPPKAYEKRIDALKGTLQMKGKAAVSDQAR